MARTSSKSSTYQQKIGVHHFAHLRAVAEGLGVVAAAQRYLGVDHGHQATTAHRLLVDQLRTLARRRGDRAWRLIGLQIQTQAAANRPSLEDFIAERDLDGWGEAEVQDMYAQAWPEDARQARRHRLRERQLLLLRSLELVAAERPASDDAIAGWFDPATTNRLSEGGLRTLDDLRRCVQAGGRWWKGCHAIGETKAARIAQYLETLLPGSLLPDFGADMRSWSLDSPKNGPLRTAQEAANGEQPRGRHHDAEKSLESPFNALAGHCLNFRQPPSPGAPDPTGGDLVGDIRRTASETNRHAISDADLINAWVAARAKTPNCASAYRRDAVRFMFYLAKERSRSLCDARTEDCEAYRLFMQSPPPSWISRRHAAVMAAGWAPFRGPLSSASQRQTEAVLSSLFSWLTAQGHRSGPHPWTQPSRLARSPVSVHRDQGLGFSTEAWRVVLTFVQDNPPSPSRSRIEFLLRFGASTGLTAMQLVSCRLGDFRRQNGRLGLTLTDKEGTPRWVAIPGEASAALDSYLAQRGIPSLEAAPGEAPLVDDIQMSGQGVGYQAIYQTMRAWIKRAIRSSELSAEEKAHALKASPSWLRHTFGQRAVESGVTLPAIQLQMGHADPRSTMRYARGQLQRLQDSLRQAFDVVDIASGDAGLKDAGC